MQRSSLYEFFEKYPDEKAAVRFFEERRWPDGICCPRCDSKNIVRVENVEPMPFRCRTCRNYFSVRTRTVMAESKIALHKWLLAIYLLQMYKKGISSAEIGNMLDIKQGSARFLCHHIRKAMESGDEMLRGILEVD